MNIRISLCMCLFLLTVNLSIAQTQYEMNMESLNGYQKVTKQMYDIIEDIEFHYANDKEFLKALQKSQKEWEEYRDAYLEARFPGKGHYGSVYPMCENGITEILTENRVFQLQAWLFIYLETDACNGSIKPISYKLANELDDSDSVIVRFDANCPDLTTWDYYKHIYDCARAMNGFIGEKSVEGYIELLNELRSKGSRNARLVERPVSKREFEVITCFPLFSKYVGCITMQKIE